MDSRNRLVTWNEVLMALGFDAHDAPTSIESDSEGLWLTWEEEE